LGLEFIDRVIKTTLVFAVLSAPFLMLYFSISFGLSVLIGVVWSVLNLWAIKYIIISLVKQGKRHIKLGLIILFLKIPVLYGLGYFLLKWEYLSVGGLLWGFFGILIVSTLKSISRGILNLDRKISNVETQA